MTGVLDHVELKLMQSMDDVFEFKRWLGERREIMGVDTETTGFGPERERIRLIQFGDYDTGWAIPWERWGGVGIEVMERYTEPIVLHNSKFDARFISRHGAIKWPWHRTDDTMAMAHIVNPLRSKGLKPLAARLVDKRASAMQRTLDEGMTLHKWTWATVPFDFKPYWIYAALDPVLTCHMWRILKPQVNMEAYRLEMGTTRIVADMETRGARVNLEYCDIMETRLNSWVRDARDWIRANYGMDTPTDMTLLKFFQDQGIPMLHKLTPGGRQSFDKDVLESIDHPLAEVTLKIRKAEKTVGPYFKNFRLLADGDILHPDIWVQGTRTDRMSITKPALQTLPRKDPTVRGGFIPRDGNALVTCDYDQIEARLTAHFSGDEGLIAAFGGDDDFFCTIASQIFNEPIDKKDPRRQLTKNTIYGKIYGAGVDKMALTARVPFETMDTVVASFDARFPGVKRMQYRINQQGRATNPPAVQTPTGRWMYADDSKEYTLTNYLIQCHAAEILKRKMIELDAEGVGDYMILPVHDELVFDCPAELADEVARKVQDIMADRENYLVPITASADVLTSDWGQKYR